MTRDEAIEIEKRVLLEHGCGPDFVARIGPANIDALIELGLLKVDEPINKCIEMLASELEMNYSYVALLLNKLGYKVVAK